MVEHTIRAFDAELQELARKITEMGRLCDEQIVAAIEALVNRDNALAKRVIDADDRIDALQSEVEEKVITAIARRQPMAVDLRQIVAALRISNDLERVGDLAENVAKRVPMLTNEIRIDEAILQFRSMAKLVREQLSRVLGSYAHRNVTEAMAVWRKDQEVDAINTSLFRELLTYMMENPRNITFCTHLLFCAKNIERIGDHATNIAESVVYMVEGRPIALERPKADFISRTSLQPSV